MTIINDIKIKDHYVYNLPENGELSSFARKNRKAGNLAEVIFLDASTSENVLWTGFQPTKSHWKLYR